MIYKHHSATITYMQQADRENLHLLSKRIKQLRLSKEKSLNKFVMTRGGLTTASWSRLENGKFDAKFSTLVKTASMLEISLCELLKDLPLNYTLLE